MGNDRTAVLLEWIIFVVPTPFFWSSKTAILNFNEDDVNQRDNLASKDDIRAPRSTLLDKVNWKRGSPYNNLASRNDIRRLLSTLLDTRTLGDLIAMT